MNSDKKIKLTSKKKDKSQRNNMEESKKMDELTFSELGVGEVLCNAVNRLGWLRPTAVQLKALPPALQGRDLIGLAETGSGKTGAFAIPILQHLNESPSSFSGLIVTPTRELALQIRDQVTALGEALRVRCACVLGGDDFGVQALEMLAGDGPHVIVGTPGRLVDHLEHSEEIKTKLKRVKFFVLDEADRLLNSEFEIPLQRIIAALSEKRQTFLFSATMTKKVEKLQRAALVNPVKVSVSTKGATVAGLEQRYLLVPRAKKDSAVVHLLRSRFAGRSTVLFTDTCREAQRLALTLRFLRLSALPLHGRMSQARRAAALTKFRAEGGAAEACCLVATDVASRGLDIPGVDAVLNYSVPLTKKDYVHRVGRTARAGRSGLALTLVTQYDVGSYQLLEQALGKKLEAMDVESKALEELMDSVRRAEVAVKKVSKIQ